MARLAEAARAALSAEDPFLFHRWGADWRWLSFAAVEAAISSAGSGASSWESDPAGAAIGALSRDGGSDAADLLTRLQPSDRRDILVLDRPPGEAFGGRLLRWAAASGAAVVLEPQREQAGGVIAWARPTVIAGTTAELEALGERLLRRGSPARLRRRLGPLGRLRAVVVLGGGRAAGEPWSTAAIEEVPLG